MCQLRGMCLPIALSTIVIGLAVVTASGETLEGALVAAYLNNPTLNAQRAATRAVDERVPQALAGFRPQISAVGDAAQIALNGVQEEFRVGQRTTLDVLNARAERVSARTALIVAQRDRVANSYSLLAATGKLNAAELKLGVQAYAAETHYNQVRDSWFGMRTPDGR